MKLKELNGVIRVLQKYDVNEVVKGMGTYLSSLNAQGIENIINLELPSSIDSRYKDFVKTLLSNIKLINRSDAILIANLVYETFLIHDKHDSSIVHEIEIYNFRCEIRDIIIYLISDESVAKHGNLLNDLMSIKNIYDRVLDEAKKTELLSVLRVNLPKYRRIINNMTLLASNSTSLKNDYHDTAMEIMENSTDEKMSEIVLDIEYRTSLKENRDLLGIVLLGILKSGNIDVAKACEEILKQKGITENPQIETNISSLFDLKDKERIKEITKTIKCSKSYNSKFHGENLKALRDADLNVIKFLGKMTRCDKTLNSNSPNHIKYLNVIKNAESKEEAKAFYNIIIEQLNEYSELDEIKFNLRMYMESNPDFNIEEDELPAEVYKLIPKDNKQN